MVRDYDYVVLGGGIVGSALAEGLAAKGNSVVLIERGGETIATQVQAYPIVKCLNRKHGGCFEARNHVLGGNGYYWGGGLIRPPDAGVHECLGIFRDAIEDSATLATNFSNVERGLNIVSPPGRAPFLIDDIAIGDCDLSEIFVLPGVARNTTIKQLAQFNRMPNCETLTSADVVSFAHKGQGRHGRNIASIVINQAGSLRELTSRRFVIATGVVDSNLIVLAHAQELGVPSVEGGLATRLHDHLSVPIARVRLSSNRALKDIVAPNFRDGLVVGRRFELKCESGWGARGLLHFAIKFDEFSPYREIKHLLLLRQQRASPAQLLKAAIPLLAVAPDLFNIAIERVLKQRLYLAEGLSVCATLDFESFPHPANKLHLVGDSAEFTWDISEEDERSYLELLDKSYRLLAELTRKYGLTADPLIDLACPGSAIDYLHKSATDAFHLGGGLVAGVDGKGVVDENLRLAGTENVFVVSSAVFKRPSVVNPTHTLLALADRFVSQGH
jgi:hypothetical protein